MSAQKVQSKSKNRRAAFSLILSFLLLTGFISGFTWGQNQEEGVVTVKTFVSQDGVHPGGTIAVAFLLDILPGWHIHGAELADQFLVATTLMIEENDEVQVLDTYYPEAKSQLYSYSEIELQVYEGKAVLGSLLKISQDASAGNKTLKASLLYQACDEQSCMAPQTLDLVIPFRVVPASVAVEEVNRDIFAKIKFKK
jgi:DsbC/DsbD-like thiol-disulfide interchange protein